MFDAPQAQLDAYNARDLEAFMRCYTGDCVAEDGTGQVMFRGAEAMRERYARLFQDSPNLHCRLVSRVRMGQYVFDEEEITGRVSPDGAPPLRRAMVVYRLQQSGGGLIEHVRFYRE
jgi:hypothetical protein